MLFRIHKVGGANVAAAFRALAFVSVLGADGKVYGVPHGATSALVLSPGDVWVHDLYALLGQQNSGT